MLMRNLPVQMLSSCDTQGGLLPLRFRFEDCSHQLHTVQITEVVDGRRVEYVGLEAFVFLCKAELEGRSKLYELRYAVAAHRWTLTREVY